MTPVVTKALITGGIATCSIGGITIAYLSSGSSNTSSDTAKENKDTQSINQLPTDNNVTSRDLPPVQTPKTVTALLKEANFEIPEKNADKSKWKDQWTVFKNQYQNIELPTAWTIDGWSEIKNSEDAPDKFKDKCISKKEQQITSDTEEIFGEIKKYCATSTAPK